MCAKAFQEYKANRNSNYVEWYGEKALRKIYHHDRAEVSYSPYFRRLAFKQYHIAERSPENRTRLLHSIEVATIASGLAHRLGLDTELTEAIALGHDIGQPPCGYPADKVIKDYLQDQGGFDHGLLSAQILEWGSKKESSYAAFKGLSRIRCFRPIIRDPDVKEVTTFSGEAVDGISKHTPPNSTDKYCNLPQTLEGQLVRIADNLSYLSQEIDEGLRLGRNYARELSSYAGKTVLTINKGREKTREELQSPQPGCSAKACTQFLMAVFDTRMGPRLVAMINRLQDYNKEMLKHRRLHSIETRMHDEVAEVPQLEYDPTLEFIIDFLWTDFIGHQINEDPRVKKRIAKNEEKVKTALDYRFNRPPKKGFEKRNFAKRQEEIRFYFLDLSEEQAYRRAVAHHIATLIDAQVDRICKSKG